MRTTPPALAAAATTNLGARPLQVGFSVARGGAAAATVLILSIVMEASTEVSKAAMEIGFLDFVCRPLFAKLVDVEPTLHPCLARVDANREMWQGIIAAADRTPATPRRT